MKSSTSFVYFYETSSQHGSLTFKFSLNFFGTHVALSITSPVTVLIWIKTCTKAGKMVLAFCLYLSTNYQYVNLISDVQWHLSQLIDSEPLGKEYPLETQCKAALQSHFWLFVNSLKIFEEVGTSITFPAAWSLII